MKSIIQVKDSKVEYFGHDLVEIAKKYGSPVKVLFLDVIKKQINDLKNYMSTAIKSNNYTGKFIYSTANKASYVAESMLASSMESDSVEVSSYNDLCITEKIFKIAKISKAKPIICNGIKQGQYLDKILAMSGNGFNMLDIIDNIEEFDYLESKKAKLNVGLRVNLKSLYGHADNDRFGLSENDFDIVRQKLAHSQNLVCTTIHYHQRGFEYDDLKFYENLKIVIEKFYLPIKNEFASVCCLDLGGGTPLPTHYDFDYATWANKLIAFLKSYNLNCDIIFENGKYTFKDSMINIYETVQVKNTAKSFPWYVINGSLLIAMAEHYAVGEDIVVMPLNLLDHKMAETKLSGITCDCDDVFYDEEKGYISMPVFDKGERLFVGILGTGSYQENMNGRNGIHHCLLPEERRIVFYTNHDGVEMEIQTNELQSPKDIAKILKCNKSHLKKFMK